MTLSFLSVYVPFLQTPGQGLRLLCHQCLAHNRCSIRMWWVSTFKRVMHQALGLDFIWVFPYLSLPTLWKSLSHPLFTSVDADFLSTPHTHNRCCHEAHDSECQMTAWVHTFHLKTKTLTHWNQPKGPEAFCKTKHMLYQNIGITQLWQFI